MNHSAFDIGDNFRIELRPDRRGVAAAAAFQINKNKTVKICRLLIIQNIFWQRGRLWGSSGEKRSSEEVTDFGARMYLRSCVV